MFDRWPFVVEYGIQNRKRMNQIAVRCLVAYLFLLGLLRWAGKSSIRLGSPFDFVLALTIGDLVDDAVWAEVPLAQFLVAAATLVLTRLLMMWRSLPGDNK